MIYVETHEMLFSPCCDMLYFVLIQLLQHMRESCGFNLTPFHLISYQLMIINCGVCVVIMMTCL